jgi:sigma-B regulation protein RsbU (phosphoserine phosphatase)
VLLPMDGEPSVIDVRPGLPLGLGPSRYAETTVALSPGDTILLLSDGVFEARSPEGEFYGWDRMVAFAQRAFEEGLRPAEVLRRLIHDVITHQEGSVRDDATLVVVRWEPRAAEVFGAPSAANVRTLRP